MILIISLVEQINNKFFFFKLLDPCSTNRNSIFHEVIIAKKMFNYFIFISLFHYTYHHTSIISIIDSIHDILYIIISLQSSPPSLCAEGRTPDLQAILSIINDAQRFVYIAVMNYLPTIEFSASKRCVIFDSMEK